MQTNLTSQVLAKIIETRRITQAQLAASAGIARSVVNWHLSRSRPVRDEHLVAYLRALGTIERPMLLAAWLRDVLPIDVIHTMFAGDRIGEEPPGAVSLSLRSEIVQWRPELDAEQRSMLNWWADRLVYDPEIDEIFRGITRKAGWKPKTA